MSDTEKGLYDKYTVTRNDNSEKHKDCRYFVMDMDHDKYATVALIMYSRMCRGEYPKLADDLDAWAKEKTMEALQDPNVVSLVKGYLNDKMGTPVDIEDDSTNPAQSKEREMLKRSHANLVSAYKCWRYQDYGYDMMRWDDIREHIKDMEERYDFIANSDLIEE